MIDREKFYQQYQQVLSELHEQGFVEMENGTVKLTEKGLAVAKLLEAEELLQKAIKK